MPCKVLRKCRKDQCPTGAVTIIVKCLEGVQMKLVTFLLNYFVQEYIEAQDKNVDLHYYWIFILIVLKKWHIPKDTQFPLMNKIDFNTHKFNILWYTVDKKLQQENNFMFYIQKEVKSHMINKVPWIPFQTIIGCGPMVHFHTTPHFMYIQALVEPNE